MNLIKNIVKKLLVIGYRILTYYPIKIEGVKYKVDPDHYSFWRCIYKKVWEPQTFKVLAKYSNSQSVYFDIGSWIGPTVIYASKKCKKVVCFEPDIFAYEYLLSNIRTNKLYNVIPFNLALSDKDGMMEMSSFGEGPGDSMSSLLNTNKGHITTQVLCLSWNTWMNIAKIEKPDLIKIDIEGAEFTFLPTIRKYLESNKPTIFLSTHAPYLPEEKRKEGMQVIIDIMRMYKKCLTENFEDIDINDLLIESSLNKFQTYLFTDLN